ncbi:MAG: cellulase family glycosylhydrolase [Ferruginibacter sp.]
MRILFIIALSFLFLHGAGQGFLRAEGNAISDGNQHEIILRGIGLGGWMLQEPYMLGLSGSAIAQYDIRNKITDLVGEEKTNRFYNAWLENHCTKADIDSLASWGFNSVRLPMHYNLFTVPVEKEPVKGKNTWLTKGFQLTDSLLSWCSKNKIYLILDLHATPGGQGNDNAIADRDPSLPSLWESEANRNKTIALWEALARRYKNASWVGGYDIINEPNWGFKEGESKNGCDEKENVLLLKLQQDITSAIRKIDKKHIIIIEGNCWGNNYEGIKPFWDNNLVMSFHKYWNFNDKASIQKILDYRDKFNVPVWLGETGENSNAWFTDVISLLEKNKIGWAMWPLKKLGMNNPVQVKLDENIKAVFAYWENKAPRPSAEVAYSSLMQFAYNTNIKKNIIRHDVIDAMIRQVKSQETIPFKSNVIKPGTILYATDYDMGRAGIAYHDLDSADYWVSTKERSKWNSGGRYRNDGVDIEVCTDAISNGYNVGWIQTGEWIQYSVFVNEDALYNINVRTASKEQESILKLLLEGKETATLVLPVTGGLQTWATHTIPSISLKKGWNQLRILAGNGGFNLNYLEFISPTENARVN